MSEIRKDENEIKQQKKKSEKGKEQKDKMEALTPKDEAKEREEDQIGLLQVELEKCKKEAEKYLNKLKWVAADFDNYKKRVEKNNQRMAYQIKKEFLLGLLPVVDDIERAVAYAKKGNEKEKPQENNNTSLIKGLEMIHNNMMKFLNSKGVKPIDCLYSKFDPYLHEALMVEKSEDYEDGTIIEVYQKGYLLNKETLRPAKVKVAKKEV